MNTATLLNAVMARHSLPSGYALAKLIGISHQSVYSAMNHTTTLGDEAGIRVAELLDLDPGLVLLWLHAERTKCPPARAAMLAAADRLESATHAA